MEKEKYDAERTRELKILRGLYQKVCAENDKLKALLAKQSQSTEPP